MPVSPSVERLMRRHGQPTQALTLLRLQHVVADAEDVEVITTLVD